MQNFRWGSVSAATAAFVSVALGMLFDVQPIHIFLRVLIFGAVFFGLGFGLRFVINSFLPEILYNEEEMASVGEQQGMQIDITLDSMGEYAVPELFKTDNEEEMGNIEDLISGVFRAGYGSEHSESEESSGFASVKSSDSVDGRGESGYNDVGFFSDLEADMPEAADDSEDSSSAFQGFTPIPIDGADSFQEMSVFQKPAAAVPEKPSVRQDQFTPSLGDDDSGLGGLPDLDMMARAFSSFGAEPPPAASSGGGFAGSAAPSSGVLTEDEPDRGQYKGNKPQTLQGDFQAKDIARGLSTLLSKDK